MKKRDPKKQAKLQKITTKRAQYVKARKQKLKVRKPAGVPAGLPTGTNLND